jgi:hypothetical protein
MCGAAIAIAPHSSLVCRSKPVYVTLDCECKGPGLAVEKRDGWGSLSQVADQRMDFALLAKPASRRESGPDCVALSL